MCNKVWQMQEIKNKDDDDKLIMTYGIKICFVLSVGKYNSILLIKTGGEKLKMMEIYIGEYEICQILY